MIDRYTAKINLYGVNDRERKSNMLRQDILTKMPSSLSYKKVKLNGIETQLIIHSGKETYYKDFQSLPNQKIVAGDYVEWANQMWLVYTSDSDDEIYTTGKLRQCQYKIFWQNNDGDIISRFVWMQNSSYNGGESGNNAITLQSGQLMAYIPYDKDTEELCDGIRVHMSKSIKTCKPYKLTRPDDISYGYGEKGVMNIIFKQSQYNEQRDKLVTIQDGTLVWICDYHSPISPPKPPLPDPSTPNETTDLSAVISGGSTLRCGRTKTWSVVFKDQNGNEVKDCDFKWNVVSSFNIIQTVDSANNKIHLRMDDETFIGKSFLLQIILSTGVVVSENEIIVVQGL